jgi:TRAP transporter TAXI family solute receptor
LRGFGYAVSAAQAINENTDALDVTVVSTGGAVENLHRIARGQIDLGLGTYATIYQAYAGLGNFEGNAMPGLRSLWVHSPATQVWVVREDSGVTTLSQLEGRPFTSGQRGSATEQLAMQILEILGIAPNYQLLAFSDATDAVRDNRSIGYVKAGGAGTSRSLSFR